MGGQKKKRSCLLKTNADDDEGTCCNCSSCKMRRRRKDFSGNGSENGGLILLFSSSDVFDLTAQVPMCCVSPVRDTGPESGESKPHPEESHISTQVLWRSQTTPGASVVGKKESTLSSIRDKLS